MSPRAFRNVPVPAAISWVLVYGLVVSDPAWILLGFLAGLLWMGWVAA